MAKVSVIIPAYNSEQFLGETLDSLLRQTLSDIEVIIVNDGSSDGTQKIIDEYVSKSSIFKSFTQENQGVSAARNNGLMKAAGKYVVFLDADDYYSDSSLEAFYNAGEESGADLILGRLKTFGTDTRGSYNEAADRLASMKEIGTFDKTLLWSFLVGNKCYNREKLLDSGVKFPPYKYSEEGAFFMSFVYTGAKMRGTMDACMYYRRHTEKEGFSVSQTVTAELARSFGDSLEMIYQNAEIALQNVGDEEFKKDYLQEIIYKRAFVLVMQFYRPLWRSAIGCTEYCAEELQRLSCMLTADRFRKLVLSERDVYIECPVRSKIDAALRPNMSVIVKNSKKDMSEFFESLYAQSCPLFEVIIPQSLRDSGKIPEKYLRMENIVVLSDYDFIKTAKRKAHAANKAVFGSPVRLDQRVFRIIPRLPLPMGLVEKFTTPIVRLVNFLLVKKVVK